MSSVLTSRPRRLSLADVRPTLQLVRGGVHRLSDTTFAGLILGILSFAIIAHVVIQSQLSQGAFHEQSLMMQVRATQAEVQGLQQQVTVMGAPATLQSRAVKLGMVPMPAPVFIRLSDSKILGMAKPAGWTAPKKTTVPTVDLSQLALTADGAHVLEIEQLPTDDGAVIVHQQASK
jgi:hypothetical protein